MGKRKLLLAEGNEEFAIALEAALEEEFTVRICTDDRSVRRLAPIFLPDVLVLDILLPGTSGLRLLRDFSEAGLTPMVLVTTRVIDHGLLRALYDYGVEHIMLKPCSLAKMRSHIQQLSRPLHPQATGKPDHRDQIRALLRELRIPEQRQGYVYLLEAIAQAIETPNPSLSKELYPTVGKRCNVGWTSVERGIRTAISSAWRVRDQRIWHRYFPPQPQGTAKTPTNAEFICRLAQSILDMSHEDPTVLGQR